MDELTDRNLELIEVALQSAISATSCSLTPLDPMSDLNREYREALARVERLRESRN